MTTVLNVTATYDLFPTHSPQNFDINFVVASQAFGPIGAPNYAQSGTIGILDPNNNVFPTPQDAIVYYSSAAISSIVNDANTQYGAALFTGGIILNNINQENKNYLDAKQDLLPTGATTSQYLGGDLTFHNLPGAMTRIQNAVTVAFGTTGSQVSSTRDAMVSYSVSIANALTLTGGAAGYVSLEISPTSTFTTTQEVSRIGNANSGGLVVGLSLNDQITGSITGFVPAGYYRRLTTHNTTGTPTYAYICGQETLI